MRLSMQPIKPRKNFFDYRLYEPEIRAALEDTGDVFVQALDNTVSTWEHKPEFKKRMTVKSNEVYLDVYATGEEARIFNFVDKGTRVRYATMTGDFQAKSSPGSLRPGPGRGGVAFVSRKRPRPGIKARNFIGTVMDANKGALTKAVAEAIREAMR